MMYNIVELIRDIEQGQNTLMALEELLPLGKGILIFRENVPNSIEKRRFNIIDSNWIKSQNLQEQDDTILEADYDKAHRNYFGQTKETGWEKSERLREALETNKTAYKEFSPSVLAKKIREANLVVVPQDLAAKVKSEIPDAKVAVLEEEKNGQLDLRKPASGDNYPRVLVRSGTISCEEPRIDRETINLLFTQKASEIRSSFVDVDYLGELDLNLDASFYRVLRKNERNYTNPVERATIKVEISDRFFEGGGLFSSGSHMPGGEHIFPLNYYGMGGKQHGYNKNSNRFLKDLRKDKLENIQEFYEKLWTQPLDSIPEILDRQTLIGQLLDDAKHWKQVRNLETALNQMYEPFVHISNMSKLICTNILGSKWGDKIHKKEFFDDYMRIARTFVESYEQVRESMASLDAVSREMQVLLSPLAYLFSEDSNSVLDKSCKFLKEIFDADTQDFFALQKAFKSEITNRKAAKLDKLEEYDKTYDRKGYKTDSWKKLIKQFHSQFPLAEAIDSMGYLDYVGSRLAAYTALAEHIRDENWVKPEILPGENGIVDIKDGWYPLTRLQHTKEPVRNNTYLDENERVEIIDGTNVGGKTIDLKKTLFIVSLVLSGNYVPAVSAKISFFNRVRYRIKNTGMYQTGALIQDLSESESVIKALGKPILVGLDETFTSTNYTEGEAITYGLVRRLSEDKLARAIITSHYPTLQEILDDPDVNGVKFSHFAFEKTDHLLEFSHRKMLGPNKEGDYAIAIAENEGIPQKIIDYAKAHISQKRK